MSERDVRLINATGYSVAQVAEILQKARQTVSRGIQKPTDYFAIPEIVSLVSHFENNGRVSSAIIDSACQAYPDLASSILAAVRKRVSHAGIGGDGEYWLICADLIMMRTRFLKSLEKIGNIASEPNCNISIFVSKNDFSAARKVFRVPGPYNNISIWPCSQNFISASPIMLIYKDLLGGASLFSASYEGFYEHPSDEAERILLGFQDHVNSIDSEN